MDRKDLLSIHQFAEVCRTTPRTVRFYEQMGLIKPVYVDPFTKYRYYEKEEQARQFLRLRLLQNFHIPLERIQKIAKEENIEKSLDGELEKLKHNIVERKKEYKFLRSMKRFLYDQDDISHLLKPTSIGPFTLICRKFSKVEFEKTREYLFETQKGVKSLGIKTGLPYIMHYETRYYKPKNSYVEICLICTSPREAEKPVSSEYFFRSFPKTQFLSYIYRGPFTFFMLVYHKLNQTIDPNKLVTTKDSYDYYLKYQLNATSEYDYLTKICFPILRNG